MKYIKRISENKPIEAFKWTGNGDDEVDKLTWILDAIKQKNVVFANEGTRLVIKNQTYDSFGDIENYYTVADKGDYILYEKGVISKLSEEEFNKEYKEFQIFNSTNTPSSYSIPSHSSPTRGKTSGIIMVDNPIILASEEYFKTLNKTVKVYKTLSQTNFITDIENTLKMIDINISNDDGTYKNASDILNELQEYYSKQQKAEYNQVFRNIIGVLTTLNDIENFETFYKHKINSHKHIWHTLR